MSAIPGSLALIVMACLPSSIAFVRIRPKTLALADASTVAIRGDVVRSIRIRHLAHDYVHIGSSRCWSVQCSAVVTRVWVCLDNVICGTVMPLRRGIFAVLLSERSRRRSIMTLPNGGDSFDLSMRPPQAAQARLGLTSFQ